MMVVLEVADELFEDTGVTVIKLRGVASRVAMLWSLYQVIPHLFLKYFNISNTFGSSPALKSKS